MNVGTIHLALLRHENADDRPLEPGNRLSGPAFTESMNTEPVIDLEKERQLVRHLRYRFKPTYALRATLFFIGGADSPSIPFSRMNPRTRPSHLHLAQMTKTSLKR